MSVPMAARRLIIILIALLVVSSLAAALAPQRQDSSETSTTTAESAPAEPSPTAGLLIETVPADAPEPIPLEAGVGDQLQLQVEASTPGTVSIPDLGLSSFASPGTPAYFDILLRAEGSYDVNAGEDGTVVARIDVSS